MKKIVLINKSDSTGGAAIVTRRLMEALRAEGVDARMLVVEKLSGSPFVETVATPQRSKLPFLWERLKIFVANRFNRATLFKIDTGSDGLPLWRHPLVKEADAVILNWVNQGMLSLDGVGKILSLGKPVAWTMHDMWCMTGVCHHAGECRRFEKECGRCPLLPSDKENDLSRKVWGHKSRIYGKWRNLTFVAVSNWLAAKGRSSGLLADMNLEVIPNVFALPRRPDALPRSEGKPVRILFAAARLDDDIKGFPVIAGMTGILNAAMRESGLEMELVLMGGIKNPQLLESLKLPYEYLGMVKGEDELRKVYEGCDIVVSASSYETLPGTLVEAQAYGCVPVSFNRGGQGDIVEHLLTGYIAEYSPDKEAAARRLAEGVMWAAGVVADPEALESVRDEMRGSVEERFSPRVIARSYLRLLFGSGKA